VLVRPIEPEDRAALAAGFERLSEQSRYRRFFSPMRRLSPGQLDYLTLVDHHDHEAIVAFDDESGDIIGVARYVRTGDDIAEPAITVADDWQGRGIGSSLLDALVRRAHEEGIHRFEATVLADNPAAIAVLSQLGDTTTSRGGPEVELLIDLGTPETPASGTGIARLLRAAAAGTVDPAMALWHRLAPRRRPLGGPVRDVVVVAMAEGDDPFVLRTGEELARLLGCSVHLVGAQRPLLDDRSSLDRRLRDAAEHLERNGLAVEVHLRLGDLAAVLLHVAWEEQARLIVVGDPGGDHPAGGLVKPPWDHVTHHADCDVLIARAGKRG